MSNPYDSAHEYVKAGFLGPLPLPFGKKHPPPTGFTGRAAPYPSSKQIDMWLRADNGAPQNICLRLGEVPGYVPKSVEGPPVGYELIGLDVDSYGTKSGADQLRGLEQKFGNLPDTVRSSARWETRPDSYTALYLVPAGYRYVGKAAPSIDVIQKAHRYLVVWPSRNPDAENALYRWRRPDGAYYEQDDGTVANPDVAGGLPSLDDVALLPKLWLEYLTSGYVGESADAVSDLPLDQLLGWAGKHFRESTEAGCFFMNRQLGEQIRKINPADLHGSMLAAHNEIIRLGSEGHGGWLTALNKYNDKWFEIVKQTGKRGTEANAEILRSVIGAIAKIEPHFEKLPDDKCITYSKPTNVSAETASATTEERIKAAKEKAKAAQSESADARAHSQETRAKAAEERETAEDLVNNFKLQFGDGAHGKGDGEGDGDGYAGIHDPDGRIAAGDYGGLGPVVGKMSKADTEPNKYDQNDRGNARHFVDIFGEDVKYVESIQGWVLWDGYRWHRDPEDKLMTLGFSVVEKRQKAYAASLPRDSKSNIAKADMWRKWGMRSGNSGQIRNAMYMAKTIPNVAITGKEFDANPILLGCKNGILVLDDEPYLRKPAKQDYVTYNTNVDYVPWDEIVGAAESGDAHGLEDELRLWQEYLELFQPDPDMRRFIQKVMGHLLVGENPEKLMIFVYGEHDTGKSTLLGGLRGALGDYYGTIDINLFKSSKLNPGLIRAVPLRVTGMSEIEAGKMDGSMIKRLTGNDTVVAEAKNSNEIFEGRPQFTTLIACNNEPDIDNADEALRERVLILPFDNPVPRDKRKYDRQADIERNGSIAVLSWLVEGWKMYRAEGLDRDAWPNKVRRICGEVVSGFSASNQFIDEQMMRWFDSDEGSRAHERALRNAEKRNKMMPTVSDWDVEWTPPAGKVYELYVRWCNANGVRPVSHRQLTRDIGVGRPQVRTVDGSNMRCYAGMKLY